MKFLTKTDPICGMTVDEATALSAERDKEKFYFCSEHCQQKFLGQIQPTLPISAKSEHGDHSHHGDEKHHAHSHHDHEHVTMKPAAVAKYFCPMHPEVIAEKPGACPKCGMALERNPAWKPEDKASGNSVIRAKSWRWPVTASMTRQRSPPRMSA
jgi:P-type Cu+ transporter